LCAAERNEALAMHHLNLTLSLLPAAAPKAQLFKAKVLVELQRRGEACDIYFALFVAMEQGPEVLPGQGQPPQIVEQSVHPYIINNYGECIDRSSYYQ
jgi:hypothetical protein